MVNIHSQFRLLWTYKFVTIIEKKKNTYNKGHDRSSGIQKEKTYLKRKNKPR